MKSLTLMLGACILVGCATTAEKDAQWTESIAKDYNTGKIEYLDLNGLPLEWSTASEGHGWLYFSRPGTNQRVWTFPGRVATGKHKTGVHVADGEIVTAVHESGRTFRIKVITQTDDSAKVMYKEI